MRGGGGRKRWSVVDWGLMLFLILYDSNETQMEGGVLREKVGMFNKMQNEGIY